MVTYLLCNCLVQSALAGEWVWFYNTIGPRGFVRGTTIGQFTRLLTLKTKSGLSLYCAPSMGSETTLPYAWLLWRFKNTLANPVTWCCRCLYDMHRKVKLLNVCSAWCNKNRPKSKIITCVLNVSHDAIKLWTGKAANKRVLNQSLPLSAE